MGSPEERKAEEESREIRKLAERIYELYGFDFRNYAEASFRRRMSNCMVAEGVSSLKELAEKVYGDPQSMDRLLQSVTVHVTSMFRDPGFYRSFRQSVVPILRTYPFFRIWHAGCSTGEEVFSMAILLEEEKLLDRCRIYATDMSEKVLKKAQEGIFPLGSMAEFTKNYLAAGGKKCFSDYFLAKYESVIFNSSLRQNMVFANHNLVTDTSFNEFHVILCRNVMIYFNNNLQNQVHKLLYESLVRLGFLCIGRMENVKFGPVQSCYQEWDVSEKVYRKIA